MKSETRASWILYMGTFPPRECGIATFTKDLVTAMDKKFSPLVKSKILAMNSNKTNIYNYPKKVMLQIGDTDIEEYIDVAKKINKIDKIKLINIQHEFGIFGGEHGNNLLAFLEIINKPVVITFHSVLPNPDDRLKKVVQRLAEKSDCIIVMTNVAAELLRKVYEVNTDIEVIPHGIPTIPFVSSANEKRKLGYEDKIILSSFGMMNPGKGYEHVIDALPNIVKKFPNVLYLIIGQTHPIVRKAQGEQYRNFIEQKIKEHGLEKNVKFYNKYLSLNEIIRYLQATDIYMCSNSNPDQVTSGTLAYAIGAGRVVVSTPFLHAKEIITPDTGVLAEFNSPESFAKAIINVLSAPEMKQQMEKNAYASTRSMTWSNVALAYKNVFRKYTNLFEKFRVRFPKVNVSHLVKLTDEFGVLQFANNIHPDRSSGYTLDDNARALIVSCVYHDVFKDSPKLNLVKRYLNFIKYVQQSDGKFYNFVDHKRCINLKHWSGDAQGRALWALGFLISTESIPSKLKQEAKQLFDKAAKTIESVKSPRAVAFTILGLYFYNKASPSPENIDKIKRLADYLVYLYNNCASKEWEWFEDVLTYSNSKLPEALFYSYLVVKDEDYLRIAQQSLNFLRTVTFEDGVFAPVGHNGWYFKNNRKAHFDQQPIDTASMVQTLLLANKITKQEDYLSDAVKVFHWFLGKNCLNRMVYDESTGGCHDGLGESAVNLNQGAESTIAYLLARLSFIKE